MAIMLQNSHFAHLQFNQMSQLFLDDFLRDLDSGKVYFTQEDVDRFNRQYGGELAQMLMKQQSMAAAADIYGTFKTRVEARVAEAKRMLAANEFDFTKTESIQRSPRRVRSSKSGLSMAVRGLLSSRVRRTVTPAASR